MTRKALEPTEIIRSPRLELAMRVSEMDTVTLRGELARALTVTAETLIYLAEVWRELERRGEDLRDLRAGMGRYIPLIAAGQLDATAVVQFAGRPALLRAMQTLPVDEQKKLATGDKLDVITIRPDGSTVETRVQAAHLTGEQVRLAFGEVGLRPIEEQRNLIESAQIKRYRQRQPVHRNYRVRVDMERGTIQVGRMILTIKEVKDALRNAGAISQDGS
jgi:hypothetical protein